MECLLPTAQYSPIAWQLQAQACSDSLGDAMEAQEEFPCTGISGDKVCQGREDSTLGTALDRADLPSSACSQGWLNPGMGMLGGCRCAYNWIETVMASK